MSSLRAVRASLVEVSRRYSRLAHEAEDLAHDLIVSALRRGASLDGDVILTSAHGAARRHGAFLARTAARRRRREASATQERPDRPASLEGAPLSALSPALQTTLMLLVQGLEKAELRAALGVSDAALRKRFQALREQGPLERPEVRVPPRSPALLELRSSQVKLLPQLGVGTRSDSRLLAVGDPDGHGLIFVEALTPGPGTATPGAPTTRRLPTKGTPCSTPSSRTSPSSSSSPT